MAITISDLAAQLEPLYLTVHNIDMGNSSNWNKSFQWFMETAQNFQSVFADQMKKLKL